MKYEFSTNNSLTDFEEVNTQNRVYLSFASDPQENIFSQKHRGSKYSSATETFICNLDLLELDDSIEATAVLHVVQGMVPLDGATACFALGKSKTELESKSWQYLMKYIGEIERGFTRPPFLHSLYAFYYATTMSAKINFPAPEDLTERNCFVLERYHEALKAVLSLERIKNFESPYHFMELIPETISISVQEEEVKNEVTRYFKQDFQKAESFELELPLKHSVQAAKFSRQSMLALQDPQSALFKFFTRNPMQYPGESGERSFPCTYVHNSDKRGEVHEHIISVPPTTDFYLKGLANLLEEMEDHAREKLGEKPRANDNPRPTYDYNDPWYDERHAQYSILDTPGDGSRLERGDIMEALWFYGCPLKTIKAKHITTSIVIPLWPPLAFRKELENMGNWQPFAHDAHALREFLPYMEDIFKNTARSSEYGEPLQAFEYRNNVQLNLDPKHILDEGPAVDIVRKKGLERTEYILDNSELKLRIFLYEYGLGLLEVIIKPPVYECSIFDTQWLEHCITLTHLDHLLASTLETKKLKAEIPHKHFACTTLTQFNYEGGHLRNGRSTGGGVQMMVEDVEPIFKNLPFNENMVTMQTVIDETSKRHYYCSATSILNFDDIAGQAEHDLAHINSNVIFNMVLAQRFMLSKSRQDIVLAESQYNNRRYNLTAVKWFSNWFTRKTDESHIEISELRDQIQHMTTNSWFNVISNSTALQQIFEKLREQMKIEEFYQEVQDRSGDLDGLITKKQAQVQSRVFDIFTFIMSPLNLVIGFVGGYQFTQFSEKENPVPFLPFSIKSGWEVFSIYLFFWGFIFLVVWLIYKWKSVKG